MEIPHESQAIKPAQVDWNLAQRITYRISQRFRYEYPAPIRDLRQKLMVIPPMRFGDQSRTDYRLDVSEPHKIVLRQDEFMNDALEVAVEHVERAVEFEVSVSVQRSRSRARRLLPGESLRDPRLLRFTDLTAPDAALTSAVRKLAAQGAEGLELAELINNWVHGSLTYSFGLTNVKTTAAEAFRARAGVCQDYAHVLLSICRQLGLPSLYVSGHMVGEGGTHAWVEVLLPASDGSGRAEAWPLDPTHGRHVGLKYVTVAVGRDYGDVAPTSGSYRAAHRGQLLARKHVQLTEVAYST